MVDILTGVMSGAHFATQIRKWTLTGSKDGAPNLGQVFIAVDPNCFAPDFEDRMTEMNGILRNLPPVRIVPPLFIVQFRKKQKKTYEHTEHSLPSKVKLWFEWKLYGIHSLIDTLKDNIDSIHESLWKKAAKLKIFCQHELTAMFFMYFFLGRPTSKNRC